MDIIAYSYNFYFFLNRKNRQHTNLQLDILLRKIFLHVAGRTTVLPCHVRCTQNGFDVFHPSSGLLLPWGLNLCSCIFDQLHLYCSALASSISCMEVVVIGDEARWRWTGEGAELWRRNASPGMRTDWSNVVNVIEGWTRPVRPNKELHTQFIRTHYGNYL